MGMGKFIPEKPGMPRTKFFGMGGFNPIMGDIPCLCISWVFFGNAFVESNRCIGFGTDFSHYQLGELDIILEIRRSWRSFPGSFWMELTTDWGQCHGLSMNLESQPWRNNWEKSVRSSPVFLPASWVIHFPLPFPRFCVLSVSREEMKFGN